MSTLLYLAAMARVGIYLRISEDKDGQQTATERQLKDCRRFAKAHGWRVMDVFEDVDLSASNPKVRRQQFERLVEAVKAGEVDAVLAWRLDRLARRPQDFQRLEEACEARGAFIVTMNDGIDTRNQGGQLVADVMLAMAKQETRTLRERVVRKQREMADKGLPMLGGHRMFGYSPDRMKIIATEAALIHEARDRIYAGEGIRGICNDWRGRGVRTTTNKPWSQTPLRRLMMSAALSGQRDLHGTFTAGTWPAILQPEDTRKLRAILTDPSRYKRSIGDARRKHLLSGMLRCGVCDEPLLARPRIDRKPRYICACQPGRPKACGKIARLAAPVDAYVVDAVCTALEKADLSEYMQKPVAEAADLIEAIKNDEAALEELSRDYYVQRRITRGMFNTSYEDLTAKVEQNRKALAKASGHGAISGFIGAGDAVRRQWEDLDLDARRSIISIFVKHIVLEPAVKGRNFFDASLVKIVWRF